MFLRFSIINYKLNLLNIKFNSSVIIERYIYVKLDEYSYRFDLHGKSCKIENNIPCGFR